MITTGNLTEEVAEAALASVSALVAHRPVILTGNAATSQRMHDFFSRAGAATVRRLPPPSTSLPTGPRFAAIESFLHSPPATWRHEIEAIDPEARGVVYAGSFSSIDLFCGRPVIGSRTRQHFDVERKDIQRGILGDMSDRRLIDPGECSAAQLIINTAGINGLAVVQGIPNEQLAMATSHTFILPATAEPHRVQELLDVLAHECAEVLTTPFDHGRPCTFYGFVSSDWTVDFGPFEALVYWNQSSWRVEAPGILRPLEMDEHMVEQCRDRVHEVARRLHEQTGYSGAFGTDGVVCNGKYVVHEINPRVCAGFSHLDEMCGRPVPLAGVDLALRIDPNRAQRRLARPLAGLAHALADTQSPQVRLWDPERRAAQDSLPKLAAASTDPNRWIQLVRDSFATEDLIPATALDSGGAR